MELSEENAREGAYISVTRCILKRKMLLSVSVVCGHPVYQTWWKEK